MTRDDWAELRADFRALGVLSRMHAIALRRRRRDELRAWRRSLLDASFIGLLVPPERYIDKRKWWWKA